MNLSNASQRLSYINRPIAVHPNRARRRKRGRIAGAVRATVSARARDCVNPPCRGDAADFVVSEIGDDERAIDRIDRNSFRLVKRCARPEAIR